MEFSFLTAFIIGLFGLTHCVSMCGGIVGTLDAGLGPDATSSGRRIAYHLTYNGGRGLSYMIAGLLAGFLGSLAATSSFGNAIPVGHLIAGLMMIALGLYLAGLWRAITVLEGLGQHVWKRIEPFGRQFFPVNTAPQAFGLGLVWGWLPCGLVYSALTLAMASASPLQGAWIMAGFGLGTLPALMLAGAFAGALNQWVRRPLIRQTTGLIIVLFGIYTCVIALQGQSHEVRIGEETNTIPRSASDLEFFRRFCVRQKMA
ncbi:MAG: sulfite exporter TauE/SafE family protein [Rhodobacteraceae bacterium]|nr:sulfite exporter TauE/SafE family protein [Paracoccaceae bacterium]